MRSWKALQLFGDYLSLLVHYHGTSGFQICASLLQIWGPAYQLYIRIGCNKSTAAKVWQGDGCWQIKTIHIVVLFSKKQTHAFLSDFFSFNQKIASSNIDSPNFTEDLHYTSFPYLNLSCMQSQVLQQTRNLPPIAVEEKAAVPILGQLSPKDLLL